MSKQIRGCLVLLLAALIWGMAFVAQSSASESMGAFAFTAMRSLLSSLALGIFLWIAFRGKKTREKTFREHLPIGAVMGVFLFMATALQQKGIAYTTAAKSGFITALYIVMVPVIRAVFGQKLPLGLWIGVLCSLVGMYLLCMSGELTIGMGDLLTLGCAVAFAAHILVVDKYAMPYNAAILCCVQFGVSGILSLIAALIFEGGNFSGARDCIGSILYVGILSGSVAYTLQIVGQKDAEPTLASLIMCMESVFAAVGGWLLLGESMAFREIAGCMLMLAGSVLALLSKKLTDKITFHGKKGLTNSGM